MIRHVAVGALLALFLAAPVPAEADSGPVLRINATAELAEGQRITVDGSGFQPGLAAVAVGLCKQGFTSGLKDCDLEGGATFVNIGADGTFPTVTLTARARFTTIDCARQQCVIAAAPLPGSEPPALIAATSAEVLVSFAGSAPPAAATKPLAVPQETGVDGPSTALWTVTAVLLTLIAALALADRRRL
ncbi:neocarzinostatin apoprotein domain-containing protein [Nocardia sp. NPDC050712]|uniref:neocarzinostatin apoprotein domain-containing protein n=1 Tax=Nocardia sp. NPDC050712 TaxID=3155518 RepID=UPI0033FB597D